MLDTMRKPAASETGDPLLLTPGPLTTSRSVKDALIHDRGSRGHCSIEISRGVFARLSGLIKAGADFIHRSTRAARTLAVEGMLTTLGWREGTVLILINGAY